MAKDNPLLRLQPAILASVLASLPFYSSYFLRQFLTLAMLDDRQLAKQFEHDDWNMNEIF